MADGERLGPTEIDTLLVHLERMAAGETALRIPLRGQRNAFDALAYGVNALVGELELARSELARENGAKTEFLQTLSHECRSPLTVILGVAELLGRDAISEKDRREFGERIVRNVRGLLAVLDDVLDLSRLTAGALVVEKAPVDVYAIVADVVTSLVSVAERKAIVLRQEAAPRVEAAAVLHTNGRRLRQILVNLVSNALKFTERGEVVVCVGAAGESCEGGEVVIDVRDTGIGIPDAAHANIFELFQQASVDITRRFGGSGLGLAVSRRFAEALGGSLRLIRSVEGEGSAFRLTLPMVVVDAHTS